MKFILSPNPTLSSALRALVSASAVETPDSSKLKITLSRAVSLSTRWKSWKIQPTPFLRTSTTLFGDLVPYSKDPKLIFPESASSKPPIMFNKVLLPQPLGPIKLTNSPFSTLRFIPFKTSSLLLPEPKPFLRLSTCSTGVRFTIGLNSYCIFEQYNIHSFEHSFSEESETI